MITKPYGLTIHDIEFSTPTELEPYQDAYLLEKQNQDYDFWCLHFYINKAVTVAIDTTFNGKKSKLELFKEPIFKKSMETYGLTEEEIEEKELQKMIEFEKKRMLSEQQNK